MEIIRTEIIKNNILMKNFTNIFKQITSRLSARWLIMALMLLVGTSSAWGWSYKTAAGNWDCKGNTGWSNETLYTTPTGSTTQSLSVVMLTNPGSGFNILRADNCNEWNGSDHNHCLYVGLTGTASSSSSTIVRATAYWYSNGLYSKYTVVIPEGKIYIKPTGGSAISMTKNTYTYTAELTLSDAKTFDLYANDPSATIQNQWDMPSAGKPTSVHLNYTNLVSDYQYVRVTYNLKTNQITFEEMTPPCPTPTPPTLPTTGEKFKRQSCIDHIQYVNENESGNMRYMAVLYEGEDVTPTQPTNGTTYNTTTNNTIGEGVVKVLQTDRTITINNLNPTQKYTLAIYRCNTTCHQYSEPLIATIDKNVPTLGELTINGNEFSVPVTKIGANESGVSLNIMKFQYYNEAGGNWADFGYTVSPSYSNQDKTVAGGNITATITPGALTQGQTYQVRACVTNNSCSDLNNYAAFNTNNDITYTVPCSTVAEATLAQNVASVCLNATQTVNLNTLAGVNNVNWYKGNNKVADPTQVAITTEGTTTYVVKAVNGLCESEGVEFTLTVNPLPTITSISASNDEPVLFEDVVLTADGVTPGAEVKWYLGDDDTPVATGTTYIVTSENAGEVIVKAKAFLNGCESDEASYIVNFEAEGECEHEIINNTNKTKVRVEKISDWSSIKIYAHSGQSTGDWPGADMTAGTGEDDGYYVYTFESVSSNFKVIFNNGSSNGENQTVSGTATQGKVCTYTIGANSCSEDNNSRRCLTVTTTDYKTTGDVIITAPAVKTVSVNSEQGSGVVNFVGRVIKTGCADNDQIWVGYQYKLATDEWPTTGVTAANQAGANPLVLNPLGNPNGLDPFTANITLTDGTYDFRAYVINGYEHNSSNYDQGVYYGLSKRVTVSSVKYPVENPVLQWIDEEGDPYPGGAYCPDATAYVKLTYGGSKPETVVWSNSISDSNPVLVKETLHENWYKLTVEKSGDLSVSLANEKNTTGAVQADAISLTMTSRISFPTTEVIDGKTTICSNDANGTELKITNAVVDYQYALYKVTNEAEGTSTIVEGPTTATAGNKDNLTFTIQGVEAAGKYFVQVEETVCDQTAVSQGYTTIEVIDAGAITLTLEPSEVTVNPWLPAVLTVSITEGYDYTINIPDPLVYTANGNVYTIKAPEPADAEYQPSSQQNQKQYGKVTFDDQEYIVTADLKTDTGSSCITEQTSTITLTPYVEDCVSDYENP